MAPHHDASRIRARLDAAVAGDVDSSPEFRRYYSVDASSYIVIPEVVVAPRDADDVSATVMIAREFGASVTARGAGTGLVGGALNSGIILDMRHLDSVRIAGRGARVGVGVQKGRLDMLLLQTRAFFAPNPSVGPFCTVGGMLANNAAGSRSLKYGAMIDNVDGVFMVDGRGDTVSLPCDSEVGAEVLEIACGIDADRFPKAEKNSSGYRLDAVGRISETHKALVGSEGTLGVFVSAELSLADRLGDRILYVLEYESAIDAATDCARIVGMTGPTALEFVDRTILEQMDCEFESDTDCLLLAEYESKSRNGDSDIRGRGSRGKAADGEICDAAYGARRMLHADTIAAAACSAASMRYTEDDDEIAWWWKHRDASLHYSLGAVAEGCEERVPHVIEDASVPVAALPELFADLKRLNSKYDARTIAYGHAGSGNIHVRLICKKGRVGDLGRIASDYFARVVGLGGSITGEHGDGLARSEYVKLQYGPRNMRQFQKLKELFDPDGVLNPGKILGVRAGTVTKNLWNFTSETLH